MVKRFNSCFAVGFYAAECYCQSEINCDGARFELKRPQRCTALRSAGAPGNAVVGVTFFHKKVLKVYYANN